MLRRRNPSMADNLPSMTWLRANAKAEIEAGDAFLDAVSYIRGREDTPKEESLLKAAWEELEEEYSSLVHAVSRFSSPIRVFRAVGLVGGVDALRVAEVGSYWTWDRDAAQPYEAKGSGWRAFIVEGTVAPEHVDWEQTLIANMTKPGEMEVTIRRGAPIRVFGVYDEKGKQVRGAFDARANPRHKRRY